MSNSPIKFDLISNAKSSLEHAVEHLTSSDGFEDKDVKHCIKDIAHAVELFVKERIRRVHPAFVWQNVDHYPSSEGYKINSTTAIKRLEKIAGVILGEDERKTIEACKKLRDSIEHYEFELHTKEAKNIIGRMLAFIFGFTKKHLSLDLEQEFKKDDRWKNLLDVYEFWEAQSQLLEKQFESEGKPVRDCPGCGANTFLFESCECALCGHTEHEVQCQTFGDYVLESDAEIIHVDDSVEGYSGSEADIINCKECIKEMEKLGPADYL